MTEVQCVQSANAILGECPNWDARQGVLLWLDIKRPAIFRWEPGKGQTAHWPMPEPVGCVYPCESGKLVFADAGGFGLLDPHTGQLSRILNPEAGEPGNRFNDGKVDRAGRFWAGTMHDQCSQPTGSLYRLDTDLSVHRVAGGFTCSNGLGWSPDDRTMYVTDSTIRTIWAYDFDLYSGDLGERRIFARLGGNDGVPDGLAVDSEGFIWSAIWDGWRLIRFTPDGAVEREIRLPVQRPTSCAFGGTDLKTLYITSAAIELGWDSLQKGPLAGAVFSIRTEMTGLQQRAFAL